MMHLRLDRIASVAATALVLVSCQSQTTGVVPSQSNAPSSHAAGFTSQATGKLLYVAHGGRGGAVSILTFPAGKPFATIRTVGSASAICSDSSGNVWVVAFKNLTAYEFAHGATTPSAQIPIRNAGYATGCAVDPQTGDLAVTIGSNTSQGALVDVWPGARNGKPKTFKLGFSPTACTYDDAGNLFVDGYIGSTVLFELDELIKGSSRFTSVRLDKNTFAYPGGMLWDGTYVAIGIYAKGGTAILRVRMHGSIGEVVQPFT